MVDGFTELFSMLTSLRGGECLRYDWRTGPLSSDATKLLVICEQIFF